MIDYTVNWETWEDFEDWWSENAQDITSDNYYDVCSIFQRHNLRKLFATHMFGDWQHLLYRGQDLFDKAYTPVSKYIYNTVEEFNPSRPRDESENVNHNITLGYIGMSCVL